MRYLILLLAACSAWGQISFPFISSSGAAGTATTNMNAATAAYGIVFVAPTATSVTGFSAYSSARGTANVDTLRVQITEVWGTTPGNTVTYTDASDLINFANNPLANGDVVRFSTATTLPTGIVLNTDYFVCNTSSTTFQIDDDSGCASIVTDFSGSSGTQYFVKVVASSTTFTPSPVTAATWVDFSSFSSHTLVAGRKYAAMMLNTEAVPATDSITMQSASGENLSLLPQFTSGILAGFASTTHQASNITYGSRPSGYVTLASGVKLGSPANSAATDTNMRINGTREAGAAITISSNVALNVSRIGTQFLSGTGASYPKAFTMKLYLIGASTDTLVDSCDFSTYNPAAGTGWWCNLSTSHSLSAGSTYRVVVMAQSSAGDASNYTTVRSSAYRSGETWDLPFSASAIYCAATCTTTANWTAIADKSAAFIIGLDSTTPFSPSASATTGGSFVVTQ